MNWIRKRLSRWRRGAPATLDSSRNRYGYPLPPPN